MRAENKEKTQAEMPGDQPSQELVNAIQEMLLVVTGKKSADYTATSLEDLRRELN